MLGGLRAALFLFLALQGTFAYTGSIILDKESGCMKYLEKNPFIMIVVGVLGISMSAIFVRLSQAPSVITAACRLIWTVLLMSPVVWGKTACREELLRVGKKELLVCIVSGIFLAAHFTVWFESLKETSVASSTAIVCTEVVWVALGFRLFMKGTISRKAWLCIAIALVGSMLIAFSDSSGQGGHLYGDLLALLAAIAVAVYTLLGRIARKTMSTTVYTYVVYSACAVTLAILTAVQGYSLSAFTPNAILVGLLLSVFSTILGHSIFSWCLKYFSPAFVSASKLCEPFVASFVAVLLFREVPRALQVLGGVIVVAGVYLYSREERKAE